MHSSRILLLLPLLLALPACEDVTFEDKGPREWAAALSTVEPHERLGVVAALNDRLWPYAGAAIPGLLSALDHEDAQVRLYAAQCLGRIGEAVRGEAAVPLAGKLTDSEAHVRCAVARALGDVGDEASVAPLIDALASESEKVRACAAAALGRFGEGAAAAVSPLVKGLKDEDARARLQAAIAHAKVTGDLAAAKPVIDAALQSPSGPTSREQIYVHEAAIQDVGDLGALGAAFVPALLEVVRTNRSFARDFAAASLAKLGEHGRPGIPLLVEGLDDPTFRQAAARALASFGPEAKAAVPGLTALLDRPTWKEGSTVAARALAAIGPAAEAAVPALTRAMWAQDRAAAEAALIALGAIGPKASSAVGAIRLLLNGRKATGAVRAAAVRAYVLVGGQRRADAESELWQLLSSDDPEARRGAAEALAALDLRSEEVLEALEGLAERDQNATARSAAAAASAQLGR